MAIGTGSTLLDISNWFAAACDGTWEHRYGISVQSTDNPGWWVQIDLTGTPLSKRPFRSVVEGMDGDGRPTKTWLDCHVVEGVWHGAGDETRLQEILERFVAWSRPEA